MAVIKIDLDYLVNKVVRENNLDMLLEYRFVDKEKLAQHYIKHVVSDADGSLKMPTISIEEYDDLADKLSNSAAGNLNQIKDFRVVGYTSKSGRFIKFDRDTGMCVVYADDNRGANVISLYKTYWNKFITKVNSDDPKFKFGNHLPEEQKKQK